MQNFVAIGQTVAEVSRFLDFSTTVQQLQHNTLNFISPEL